MDPSSSKLIINRMKKRVNYHEIVLRETISSSSLNVQYKSSYQFKALYL